MIDRPIEWKHIFFPFTASPFQLTTVHAPWPGFILCAPLIFPSAYTSTFLHSSRPSHHPAFPFFPQMRRHPMVATQHNEIAPASPAPPTPESRAPSPATPKKKGQVLAQRTPKTPQTPRAARAWETVKNLKNPKKDEVLETFDVSEADWEHLSLMV